MFKITMQAQFGSYATKVVERESELGVSSVITKAMNTATSVVSDDRYDGTDHGLLRAITLANSKGQHYCLTVHRY